MSQRRITERKKLLDEKGRLTERGYATQLLLDYDRKDVKAAKIRVKEWDYYYFGNDKFGVSLTIADNSYMGLASAQVLDFERKSIDTNFAFVPFPMGRMKMPSSSVNGDVAYKNKKTEISFKVAQDKRILHFDMPSFKNGKRLTIDAELWDIPKDSMVIATPFDGDERAFYYNQKINCMKVTGSMVYGDSAYNLDGLPAVLDWGRGVWTYDNTWYWSSLSTVLPEGDTFGFNIGYGFGNTAAASENMLFYNGKAHKLEEVEFEIPLEDGVEQYMKPWRFTSSDKRLEMDFAPVFDNRTDLNALIIAQDAHQVFGKFSGAAILDDGRSISFRDCMGFAEKVRNRW
ncbi:MAG: DUF2804 domain-containing protein [Clostridia bacterium]|nr:DUF2804 domain-containing protein [Clostridia bacterium]